MAAGLTLPWASSDAAATTSDASRTPNLLFIYPDQWRASAFGFATDPVATPNLDRLASEGRVINGALSNCPVCSPYRASMLTGKYPYSHGVVRNANRFEGKYTALQQNERCISDVLSGVGYSCGYIGKWHLDPADPRALPAAAVVPPGRAAAARIQYMPPQRRQGFSYWHAYIGGNLHLNPQYWVYAPSGPERFVEPGVWSPIAEADAAIGYIRNSSGQREAGKPFALWVAMNPPHPPYDKLPPELEDLYSDRSPEQLLTRGNVPHWLTNNDRVRFARRVAAQYFAAITGVDHQVGRILAALRQTGQERNTVVVFTSDHGEMLGSQALMQKNYWYSESLEVPLIVRYPGRVVRGKDNLILSTPDLMPTLLSLMGLKHLTPAAVEGQDLSSFFLGRGGIKPRAGLYLSVEGESWNARGIRTPEHTFAIEWDGSERRVHLYERGDTLQMRNVADRRSAQVKRLTTELTEMLEATRDPYRDRVHAMAA